MEQSLIMIKILNKIHHNTFSLGRGEGLILMPRCIAAEFTRKNCTINMEQCDILNSEQGVFYMKGHFLLGSKAFVDINIYANRSSIVLDWLLRVGIDRKDFSLREVARDSGASLGAVQRVFATLEHQGILQTTGLRTAKRFLMKNPSKLLNNWSENYSLIKKCKMKTYSSGYPSREEMLNILKKSTLSQKVVLALHTAAEAYGCKNNNLETLEIYMIDPKVRPEIEKLLFLKGQERGYDVLLIEPYYKGILNLGAHTENGFNISPPILTYLDLYNFPLRGHEQAEFMGMRIPEIKRIKGKV